MNYSSFIKDEKGGFTLVELLVVIAIIAVLSTAAVLVLNPAEMLKKGRDATRLTDMDTLKRSLSLAELELDKETGFGHAQRVYTSLPDTDNQMPEECNEYSLPSLPDGWAYVCRLESKYRNTDGTGWMPVNFTALSVGSPIPALPVDPQNNSDLFYTYAKGSYEVTAQLESRDYRTKYMDTKGLIAINSGEHALLSVTPKRKVVDSARISFPAPKAQ